MYSSKLSSPLMQCLQYPVNYTNNQTLIQYVFTNRMEKFNGDVHFMTYGEYLGPRRMADELNKVPTKLYAWAPHGVLPELFPRAAAVNRMRPREVLLIGTIADYYDLRPRWKALADNSSVPRLKQYAGIIGNREVRYADYRQALREAQVCLIGTGVHAIMTLRKYIEVLASGGAIVGSVPADSLVAPLVQATPLNTSDSELIAQIQSAQTLSVPEAERRHTVATRVFSYDTVFSSHIVPALRRYRAGQRGVWLTNTTNVQLTSRSDTEQWCKTVLNGKVIEPAMCTVEHTSLDHEDPQHPWFIPMEDLRRYVQRTITDAEQQQIHV
jgi:hypothetical protein